MLTESFVSSILEASIAGAGLVLAVYALVIPIAGKIFELKAKVLLESLKEFKDTLTKLKDEFTDEDKRRLEELTSDIVSRKIIPTYLSLGTSLVFVCYMACALFSVGWFLNWNRPTIDVFIAPLFAISTIIFLLIGILTVKDVSSVLKEQFKETVSAILQTKK